MELLIVATCATASIAAVSVRRRDVPSEIGCASCSRARSISSVEKSPSGPISIVVSVRGARVSKRYVFLPFAQCAMKKPNLEAAKSWNVVIGLRIGSNACLLCFAAEMMILFRRSGLIVFRSEKRHVRGVISSIPISTAFSMNHSKRSMFFVGATAMWRWYGCAPGSGRVEIIRTSVRFGCGDIISAENRLPEPSIISTMSPATCLRTRMQCCDSSSGRKGDESMSGA